jgi:hypothetical protein
MFSLLDGANWSSFSGDAMASELTAAVMALSELNSSAKKTENFQCRIDYQLTFAWFRH